LESWNAWLWQPRAVLKGGCIAWIVEMMAAELNTGHLELLQETAVLRALF